MTDTTTTEAPFSDRMCDCLDFEDKHDPVTGLCRVCEEQHAPGRCDEHCTVRGHVFTELTNRESFADAEWRELIVARLAAGWVPMVYGAAGDVYEIDFIKNHAGGGTSGESFMLSEHRQESLERGAAHIRELAAAMGIPVGGDAGEDVDHAEA